MDESMMRYPHSDHRLRAGARAERRPQEKGRDPYDGLRPWSAITHGAGAVLGALGTVLLLVRAASLG